MLKTHYNGELNNIPEGEAVIIGGWVQVRRDHGKLVFLDIRDKDGLVQAVVNLEVSQKAYEQAQKIKMEDVVVISGLVKKRPGQKNDKIVAGDIEIEATEVKVLSRNPDLPLDLSKPELGVTLPTLLKHRPVSLRHQRIAKVFKVQEQIVTSFRQALKGEGFTEVFVPTIVPTATEGGAEVFPVEYYDKKAYLAQSPQFYKQIMVSVFEKVFTIAHAYRAEPSVTTRHLSEYVSLDAEMGFVGSYEEIMDVVERVIREIFLGLENEVEAPALPKNKIPKLKLAEAQEIIFKRTKRDNRKEPDLEPEDEKEICRWALEEHKSDLVFITHYPTSKRPFYTFPDPEDPELTLSFDLLGKGLEWVTGGQRINNHDQLVANIKKWGNDPRDFAMYLEAFKYGMPPEGGFALGLERITKDILGLKNIREASLFPRDMDRVDIKLSSK